MFWWTKTRLILLSAVLLFAVMTPYQQAIAAAPYQFDAMGPDQGASSYALYYAVVGCIEGINDISNDDVIAGSFSGSGRRPMSYYLDTIYGDGSDGVITCSTATKSAVTLWGYKDLSEALSDWGYTNPGGGKDWHADKPGERTAAALRSRIYSGQQPKLIGTNKYLTYRTSLMKACEISEPAIEYDSANAAQKSAADSTTGDAQYVRVTQPTDDYKSLHDVIYKVGKFVSTNNVWPSNSPQYTADGFLDCRELAKKISENANSYMTWAQLNPDKAANIQVDNQGKVNSNKNTPTCAVEGIGWIVCPVVNFLAEISDAAHGQINNLLTVDSATMFDTSGKDGSVYPYWQTMRNYANIVMIGAFLVIIYSQITGAGISNYGLKRMLPRLIIIAIATNLSFYICALAVDVSNFLGVATTNFVSGAVEPAKSDPSAWAAGGSGFRGLAGKVLIGVATIAAGYFMLASIVGMLIFVVIAAVSVLFILGLRQALIILLVVVSPLAFVAYLLPNTEGLFKKWWGMFKALLMIFPIIGLLYGAGKLASVILGTSDKMLVQIVAGFLLFAPLVMAYTLLKASLSAFGALGQLSGKFQGSAHSSLNKRAQDRLGESTYGLFRKYRQNEATKRSALTRAGQYEGKGGRLNPRNWASRGHRRFNEGQVSGKFGDRTAAMGVSIADKQEEEEVNDRIKLMKRRATPGSEIADATAAFHAALKSGDTTGQQAAIRILGNSGNPGLQALHAAVREAEQTNTLGASQGLVKKEVAGLNLKARDNSLESWSRDNGDPSMNIPPKTLDQQVSDGSKAASLTTAELMGQDYLHLHKLATGGHISVKQAQAVLSDPNQAGIAQDKRELMEDIVASSTGRTTISLSPDKAAVQTRIYG